MKKVIGIICILLGLAMLGGACFLLTQNQLEEAEAERAAVNLLPQLFAEIEENVQTKSESQSTLPSGEDVYVAPPEGMEEAVPEVTVPEMEEVEIDGFAYIGYLSIPALKLDLPIMADWDYYRLRIAPCRYTGTVQGGDLVIMAHNYNSHFGRLSKLSEGDAVTFTDMNGVLTEYEVVALDILNPDAVDEMTAGIFDLTLFTCTYGGRSRVTVYCDLVKN